MPAIPVYARLEMHLTEGELRALATLAHELVQDHALDVEAVHAGKASEMATARLNAACNLYAAAMRTMRERNLSA